MGTITAVLQHRRDAETQSDGREGDGTGGTETQRTKERKEMEVFQSAEADSVPFIGRVSPGGIAPFKGMYSNGSTGAGGQPSLRIGRGILLWRRASAGGQ